MLALSGDIGLGTDMTRRALVSQRIRQRQRPDGNPVLITDSNFPSFWEGERLPTPQEQVDNLILWIGDHQSSQSTWAVVTVDSICAEIGAPLSKCGNAEVWSWLFKQIDGQGLFEYQDAGGRMHLSLKMPGWKLYHELKRRVVASRKAFMAMQFGDATLDRVFEQCFRKAASRAGFDLRRVSDRPGAGNIDAQIEAGIRASRFLVADLTHGNHGAYWEAGMAHGLGLPVIYTCEKSVFEHSDKAKRPHFDTSHHVTIVWEEARLKAAEDDLTAKIRNTPFIEAKLED
jgi:hypothetical protein